MYHFDLNVRLAMHWMEIYLAHKWKYICVLLRFYPARKFILQQSTMLKYWWRRPAERTFDITPQTPARKVFGTHLPAKNGAFRPTLCDVVFGKARREYFGVLKKN